MYFVEPKAPVIKETEEQRKNREYLQSPEWKAKLEKARNAKPESFTVIYRDTDQELKEAWHFLSEDNIDYVKEKYKKAKKEILHFVKKELDYGEFLNSIKGNSKLDGR
jgi:transketolase